MKDLDKRKIYDLINILNCLKIIKKISKGVYVSNGLENCQEFLQEIPLFRDLDDYSKNDQSVNSLTLSFLSLLKTSQIITQEKMILTLFKNLNSHNKSKNRKILEIRKILTALGICHQTHKKKTLFLNWKPEKEFIQEINHIIKSEKIDYKSLKNNEKFQQHQSTIINNLTKFISKNDMFKNHEKVLQNKSRTISFDTSVVEKYLMKDINNNLILPKVNLPLLKEK